MVVCRGSYAPPPPSGTFRNSCINYLLIVIVAIIRRQSQQECGLRFGTPQQRAGIIQHGHAGPVLALTSQLELYLPLLDESPHVLSPSGGEDTEGSATERGGPEDREREAYRAMQPSANLQCYSRPLAGCCATRMCAVCVRGVGSQFCCGDARRTGESVRGFSQREIQMR